MSDKFVVKQIVFVGDGNVGKTSIMHSFVNKGEFNPTLPYVPTTYDVDEVELVLDKVKHLVKLHDVAGQESYDRLRNLMYLYADCFVLCYSVDDRASFLNIFSKWYPEVKPYKLPIVLVGTKSDLKIGINAVKVNEGEKLRKRINANQFLECSAKNNQNINEVIYEAVRAAVAGPMKPPQIGCCQSLRRFLCCYKTDYEPF